MRSNRSWSLTLGAAAAAFFNSKEKFAMAVDETRWAAWDSTPSVSSRAPKRPRARVKSNWLRRAVPASEEIEESARALKLVAETTLEHCFEALLSSRGEMPDAPTSVKKLHIAWDHLLKKTYRKCAESVLNELGQVKLQPLYPEMQVQEEFLCNRALLGLLGFWKSLELLKLSQRCRLLIFLHNVS